MTAAIIQQWPRDAYEAAFRTAVREYAALSRRIAAVGNPGVQPFPSPSYIQKRSRSTLIRGLSPHPCP